MLKRLMLVFVLCIPISVWAFFKPVRVIAPELTELSCVNEIICIDNVSLYKEAVTLYEEALHFVESSVGTIEQKPKVIFCSTQACSQSFGLGIRTAINIGTFGIVISPRAWKPYYVRHEMIHHLQNERLGMLRVWRDPKWIIEGMAYTLSQDPRPKLSEPFEQYRSQFKVWYKQVGKEQLWTEVRKL